MDINWEGLLLYFLFHLGIGTTFRVKNVVNKAILKKTSVSGVAAGCFIKVRMGTFFFIFAKKIFFFKNGQYFPTKKKNYGKKKKKCGLPTGFKKGHPLDRKQKFFLGWPNVLTLSYSKYLCNVIRSGIPCKRNNYDISGRTVQPK